jgi:hypothetical protein
MKGPRKLDAAGWDGSGVAAGAELAGTMISGMRPVDAEPPVWPVGVGWTTGAGLPVDPTIPPRSVERRPSAGGDDAAGVGWTIGAGLPVDPTIPPRTVERRPSAGADDAAGADGAAGVGCTTGAGLPVDPTIPPRSVERRPSAGADDTTGADGAAGVGCTTGAGLPVDPTIPPSSVERRPSAGADEGTGVGCRTSEGMKLEGPADEPTEGAEEGLGTADVGGTITPGSRPVEPRIGSRGLSASDPRVDDCTGVGSAFGSGEEVGCTITDGRPEDDGPRAGLEGTSSGASLLGASGLVAESDLRSVDPPLELDWEGGGTSSSGDEETGAGDARWFPVPG